MKPSRLALALGVGALVTASMAPAHAQTTGQEVTGTGTTTGSLTVLGLDAGRLLSLDLLSDSGLANTDEAVGDPAALAEINALTIDSPATGISQTVPVVAVESTGEPQEESRELRVFDNPVVSGTLVPMSLTAAVDDDGATSGLFAGLTDLDVLDGLVSVVSTEVGLDADALTADSDGLRGARIDEVTVLDLESLLAGLGLPVTGLPLETVLDLVDSLGLLSQLAPALETLGLPGVDTSNLTVESLVAAAGSLGTDLGLLESLATDLAASTCDTADPAVSLLGDLTGQTDLDALCADLAGAVADTAAQITNLTDQLGGLLEAPLDVLSGTALVALEGLDVGVTTKATDDVATSVADVTATLGGITVGATSLDGFDLTATAEQIAATVDQVESAIGGILGQIDPRLADLVDIAALESTTSVVEDAGAVVSSADFTGLRIQVLPDVADLVSIIEGFAAVDSIGDQLGGLGLTVPATAPEITELNSLLAGTPTSGVLGDGAVYALSEGLTVEVASLSQQASFVPASVATPATPQPALPMTGSNDTLILLLGGAAVAVALTARRLVRRAE